DWTGEAKEAAQNRKGNLTQGSGNLLQALNMAPDNITSVMEDYVQQDVIAFCRQVVKLRGDGTIGEMSESDVQNAIDTVDKLPDLISKLDEKIEEIENRGFLEDIANGIVDIFASFANALVTIQTLGLVSLPERVDEDNIRETREKLQTALRNTQQKLVRFCRDYEQRANSVHRQARTWIGNIQQCYSSL